MSNENGVKIARLKAENVLSLEAFELGFDDEDNAISVRGKNAQGKTSLLNLISYAFCGKRAIPEDVLPEDAEKGTIEIGTTGNLVVERTITEKDAYLRVRTKDGEKLDAPQKLLQKGQAVEGDNYDPVF